MNKKPIIPYLFFMLVYANQGISGLPDQCIYYLTRENWGLSAGMIGLIGLITGLAWYIKPVWGFLIDYLPIKRYRAKYYLYLSYTCLILAYLYIIGVGLNFWSLIITGTLINCFIGINDVANDSQMVIYEQKYKMQGKLQAIQWTSLGVAGLVVALLGAKIAEVFPDHANYKVAYGIAMLLPLLTLWYLLVGYKEKPTSKKRLPKDVFKDLKKACNPKLLICLLFVACFQLCPSFGTALMIKARESLGVEKMFIGYLGATGTVLGIVGYALYYWKFHKFPMKKLIYFMVIFTAMTNLFYLYIPNKWFLLTYNVAFGAFSGITFLTLLAFFASIVPKGSEGMIYAVVTSISNFCARGGSWIGGMIYDNYGYNANVLVSTALTLMCLFFIPKLKIGEPDAISNTL
jgi:MFS family permease